MTESSKKRLALVLLGSPLLVIAGLAFDARSRRAASRADDAAVENVARRLVTSDLALSGGARWLRAPSLEEPFAAFADGPASPDPDPAGGAMAPPSAVWAEVQHR